jgi:hypothetical protein
MSRAADTHLVLREHELAGHLVIDAATRSWKPLEPTVVRFEYPLFHPEPLLAPTLKKKAKKDDGWNVERFVDEVVGTSELSTDEMLARVKEFRREATAGTGKRGPLLEVLGEARNVTYRRSR